MPQSFVSLARLVAEMAKSAAKKGTFGVAGALVDETGSVLTLVENKVIHDHAIDTTMHVEMQLITWLREHKRHLPERKHTIISSLEPCLMCGGSILREQMTCVALTTDDDAGVGIHDNFSRLPASLVSQAKRTFFLANHYHSDSASKSFPRFARTTVQPEAIRTASEAFKSSLAQIRSRVSQESEAACLAPPRAVDGGQHTVMIVDSKGSPLIAEDKQANEEYLHFALIRAVKRFNRIIGRSSNERSKARFVFRSKLKDEIDLVVSVGVIGSFYENHAPEPAILLEQKDRTVSEYNHWLAHAPPFYANTVGLVFQDIGNVGDFFGQLKSVSRRLTA